MILVALGAAVGGFLVAGLLQEMRRRRSLSPEPGRQPRNVLFVCTGNLYRSPTAEAVFRQIAPGTYRTRSAGILGTSPHPLSEGDVRWADVVAVMESHHRAFILERWPEAAPKVRVLEIEDLYDRNNLVLLRLLEVKLEELLAEPASRATPPSRTRQAV